jgi:hypothetical protein
MHTDRCQTGRRSGTASEGAERSPTGDARVARHRGVAGTATPSAERGQTTLDFAVGMGLFLISLVFILVFVPGMLDPFTAGTQEETTAVNRVTDQLSQQLLGNATEPYVLDTDCTVAFFEGSTPPDCRFTGTTLQSQLGLQETMRVNITLRSNVTGSATPAQLCWDGSSLSEAPCGSDTRLARGPLPSSGGSKTVSARRVVVLDGHDVTIEVEMW